MRQKELNIIWWRLLKYSSCYLPLFIQSNAPSSHIASSNNYTCSHFDFCIKSDVTVVLFSNALGSQKLLYIKNLCAFIVVASIQDQVKRFAKPHCLEM